MAKKLKVSSSSKNFVQQSCYWFHQILPSRVREAKDVLEVMIQIGEIANVVTYNSLMDGYCSRGQIEEAEKATTQTYTIMINGLCLEGLLDEAKEFLIKMEKIDCFPNSITYSVIIQGFLKSSQYNKAIELIGKMVTRGFSADSSTISRLVDPPSSSGQDPILFNLIQKLAPNEK
ncbi:hypothetical protein LguiB_026811 [Lonicera macranthoides]